MSIKNLLIVGATSSIAYETAKIFAEKQTSLFLAGRNTSKLKSVADDLEVRGAEKVITFDLDINLLNQHEKMLEEAQKVLSQIDAVLVAHGAFHAPEKCEKDVQLAIDEFSTNATSTISLLILLAQYFEKRETGTIAVISSVAGDRGRQSNYLYGSAKAAVSTFMQGLRNRLSKAGVQVLTIKPGLVDTPLTAGMPKNFLYSSPEKIARGIFNSMNNNKKNVVYLPWFWKPVMMLIKLIPEPIFKRMSL